MSHATEAEEAFAQAKGRIARKLKAAFELKDYPDRSFLPVRKAKEIIFDATLDDLRALCESAGEHNEVNDQNPLSVLSVFTTEKQRMDHNCLVLAVLLCIDEFLLVHWRRFRDYLSRPSPQLPLERDSTCDVFGSHLGQLFYDKQFAFCPVVLKERKINDYTGIKSRCRLPDLQKVKIGSGSFSTVFKVKIPRGHLQGRYSTTTTLARKDFSIAAQGRKDFQQEWETMQQILQAKRLHPNIMRICAGLVLDSQLSIFYPLAKCNLAEYLKDHNNVLPLDSSARAHRAKRDLFVRVKEHAEALKFLHNFELKDETMASCLHMDLKPENILVCIEDNGRKVWKVSDFGMSRVERIKDRVNAQIRLNLDRVFDQKLDHSTALQQPAALGGAGTYMAPEALHSESKFTTKYDVWSLACIVLMVMSFAHGGPQEVASFQDGLSACGDGSDWFFVTIDMETCRLPFTSKNVYRGQNEAGKSIQYMQNPHIQGCLLKWASSTEDFCKEFYRVLSKLLLDEALVPDPEKRVDASEFSNSFSDCFLEHFPDCQD